DGAGFDACPAAMDVGHFCTTTAHSAGCGRFCESRIFCCASAGGSPQRSQLTPARMFRAESIAAVPHAWISAPVALHPGGTVPLTVHPGDPMFVAGGVVFFTHLSTESLHSATVGAVPVSA